MDRRWISLNDMVAHLNGTLRLAAVSSFFPHFSANVPVCVKPAPFGRGLFCAACPYHFATLKYSKMGSYLVKRGTLEVQDETDDLPNDLEVVKRATFFLCELPPAHLMIHCPGGADRSGAFKVSTNRLDSPVCLCISDPTSGANSIESLYSSHPHCWV